MVHVAVIGAYGSAGVAAAERLVEARETGQFPTLHLSLIDDGDPAGGLCILRGCMPSKAVLSAGAHRYQARVDGRLDDPPRVDPTRVVAQKDEQIDRFATHRREGVEALAERDWVDLYRQRARWTDEDTVLVGDTTLSPEYVIVATGSSPTVPPIEGINDVEPKTSADTLSMTSFPEEAVVLGFGFIGMELVPYLAEVGGVDLTVIDRNPRPLTEVDAAIGETIIDTYRHDFDVTFEFNATATEISRRDGNLVLTFEDGDGRTRTTIGDDLFVFAGRDPNTDDLRLDHLNIAPQGEWVGPTQQAQADDRIFVAGDATGETLLLHVAKEEGITAAENIVNHATGDTLERYEPIAHEIAFSGLGVYPYARVGHTEETADAAGFEAISVSRAASDDGVFVVKDVPVGQATLVVDADTARVLGYYGLHHNADVLAKTLQVILETEHTVFEIPNRAYHPTTPEILDGLLTEAAERLKGQ